MEIAISLRRDLLLKFPVHVIQNADRSQSEKGLEKDAQKLSLYFWLPWLKC